MSIKKVRPFLSTLLAICICLNSIGFVSAAAESIPPLPNQILFSDDFETYDPSLWNISSGSWNVEESSENHSLVGTDTCLIATAAKEWTDYIFSYDITPIEGDSKTSSGGVFRYQDDGNFYHFRLMETKGVKQVALLQWKNGTSSPLGSRVAFAYEIGTTYRNVIKVVGDKIECYIYPAGEQMPDTPILQYTDSNAALSSGGVGFRVYNSGQSGFDNVQVSEAAAEEQLTVSFEVNGGSEILAQHVTSGSTAQKPASPPTKDRHVFGGWYTDDTCQTPFDFSTRIASDTIIYAKWTELPTGDSVSATDDFSKDLSAWFQVKGPEGAYRIPEGDERLLASNSTGDRAEFTHETYDSLVDTVVEVDVTVVDDSQKFTVGIISRFTSTQRHYMACYTKDTGMRFIDRSGAAKTLDSDFVLEKDKTYRFKLESTGSEFRFSIDGVLIYTIENTNHPFGKVGLYTSKSSAIYFDNFSLNGSLIPEGTDFPASGVLLSPDAITMEVNQVRALSAVVEPFYATNQNVQWSSANPDIATVSNVGKVQGVGVGTTDITVKTQDGGHTASCAVTVAAAPPEREQNAVVPIKWENFAPGPFSDELSLKYAKAANNNVKYNLFTWLDEQFGTDPGEFYGLSSTVKGYAALAFVSATTLSMDVYNEELVGHSEEETLARTVKLIASIARNHRSNRESGGWGVSPDKTKRGAQDQTALDANVCGTAALLLWERIPAEYQEYVRNMVEYEANSLIDYEVPYYRSPDGTIIFKGDTKGEENSWNSGVLALALSMMPNHQNYGSWAQKCTELMISAYATPNDLFNTHQIDGKAVKDWLNGSNAENNGIAINHKRIHPDYMAVIAHLLNGAVQFALAGQPVPEETVFNADLIYQAYVNFEFDTSEYNEPGGSMYQSRSPKLYYPMTNDYGDNRLMHVASIDVFADVLGFDHNVTQGGEYWSNLHIDEILRLQNRFSDGRTYINDEEGGSSGSERWVSVHLARAMMGNWLRHQLDSDIQINFERSPEAGALPDGFMQYTVGTTYGTAEYDGIYEISTMGILEKAKDSFRYVYQYVDGDDSIAVTLRDLQSEGALAEAISGVMLRDKNKTEDAATAYLGYRDGKLLFTARECKGGESVVISESPATLPVSVKLEKSGDTIVGYFDQGSGWSKIGSIQIADLKEGTLGFFAASGSNDVFAHAKFEVLDHNPTDPYYPSAPSKKAVTNDVGGIKITTTGKQKLVENDDGSFELPAGGKAMLPDGTGIDVPAGTKINQNGKITIGPDGTSFAVDNTAISVPSQTTIDTDGRIQLPASSGSAYIKVSGITLALIDHTIILLDKEVPLGYVVVSAPAFIDVRENAWYYDDIAFVAAHELFSGTAPDRLNPDGAMTRAMFATVLARLSAEDVSSYQKPHFVDVAAGQWYSEAIGWAADKNIISGTDDGKFSPDAPITREQVAVMLMSFFDYKGYLLPEMSSMPVFEDEDAISAWAKNEVKAMQALGILKGKPDNRCDAQSAVSRAEVAAILARFIEACAGIIS